MTHSLLFVDAIETPIGPLTIVVSDEKVCFINYGSLDQTRPLVKRWAKAHLLGERLLREENSILQMAKQQLHEYFQKERTSFNLPYALHGTTFQRKVWEALQTVPYGETCSYKDIAIKIQSPKAVRAVGGAVNRNPLAIIIPCHRVIGSNGALVGYNGGLDKKKTLLKLEDVQQFIKSS
ncbi:methylated-DNA--[protein]-cysteine S-methyltransferase [Salirhabdus salicampi]|uniref:methylated-DNA--[protein]-cysteine S-methyltransferase n=1 Tax=Salirhabdus salicampi TaxID=476102 RepID=UPI0034621609